jgi:pimeloyl-ACP methyl ester carboxylesterase
MKVFRAFGAIVALVLAFGLLPGRDHARAVAFLARFTSDAPPTGVVAAMTWDVDERPFELARDDGTPIKARLYVPRGRTDPPGIVLAHGVHWKGIDEPRLVRFARTIAGSGIAVLTPELAHIADYRIDPQTIEEIGHATVGLRAFCKKTSVGLMGLSFAGGLSLLAAADPRWAPNVSFVVAVGAHDSLERVARFFVQDEIDEPGGGKLAMKAHDYGAVVLMYGYAERFFGERDAFSARNVLREILHENFDEAKKLAGQLSPAAAAKMQLVFDHREDVLGPEILRVIDETAPTMARVSPHGNLTGLRARVFLLHGAGDSVIPPSESRWLAADAPPGAVENLLVSQAIQHVELHGEPTAREKWDLVHFMAQVLAAAEAEAPSGT